MPNDRQIFWMNLEKIRDGLLHSDEEFAKYMGVSLSQYQKCRNNFSYLPMPAVFEMAEKLNFHFVDLMSPDFKLNHAPFAPSQALPEKYTVAAYSKMTPTKNIINYLELTRGTRAKTNLIRKFQLNEDYVQQEDNKTNIHMISDVVKYLAETYHFTEEEFISMGKRTPYSFTGSLLKDKLTDHQDIYGVLEAFFEECTEIFDKNCTYRISDIVNDFAIIEALPNKDVLEELKIRPAQFGNEEVCLTKMGCISSMTWFKYRRYARMEKLTSAYDGDTTNKYLMDLSPFKKLSGPFSGDVLEFKPVHH